MLTIRRFLPLALFLAQRLDRFDRIIEVIEMRISNTIPPWVFSLWLCSRRFGSNNIYESGGLIGNGRWTLNATRDHLRFTMTRTTNTRLSCRGLAFALLSHHVLDITETPDLACEVFSLCEGERRGGLLYKTRLVSRSFNNRVRLPTAK